MFSLHSPGRVPHHTSLLAKDGLVTGIEELLRRPIFLARLLGTLLLGQLYHYQLVDDTSKLESGGKPELQEKLLA